MDKLEAKRKRNAHFEMICLFNPSDIWARAMLQMLAAKPFFSLEMMNTFGAKSFTFTEELEFVCGYHREAGL